MKFGRYILRLLHHIPRVDTRGGAVFMSKVDLSDTYMQV